LESSQQSNEFVVAVITGTILFLIFSCFLIAYIVIYKKKRYKHLQEVIRMESQFQQTLLQTQLEIQEQTLKNISQEIHDNIGQALSLAKLNLNTMPLINDEALQQKILNSKELVSKAITDLRDLSRSLDTDYVQEMGLQRAIEYEMEMIRKTGTTETSIIVEGTLFRLEKQKELILFRIVQESFNNILKHAGAKVINVHINYERNGFTLMIKDDGKGVDLRPLRDGENNNFGLGIRNMHSRAKLIGADFKMSSIIGEGTEVKIVLLNERTNENK
jgi:two-component system, NarL family, sensor kinase